MQNFVTIMDEVTVRFLINRKEFILLDIEYIFILEEAYWFALDFLKLENMTFKQFAYLLLKYNGYFDDLTNHKSLETIRTTFIKLSKTTNASNFHSSKLLTIHPKSILAKFHKELEDFKKYKQKILVYGAVLFNSNMKKVLIIQQHSSLNMAFPKGKKNENESGKRCAIRETYEEVGFNIENNITNLSVRVFEKMTFYIALNIPEDFPFETKCRNEIDKIFWLEVDKIPQNEKFKIVNSTLNGLKDIINLFQETNFKFQNLNIIFDEKTTKSPNGFNQQDSHNRNTKLYRKISNYISSVDPDKIRIVEELKHL